MTDPHDTRLPEAGDRRQELALFRYGLIADLTHLPPGHRGLYALLEKKAKQEYAISGSQRRHVAAETMRGWLRLYRQGASTLYCRGHAPMKEAPGRFLPMSSTCCVKSKKILPTCPSPH